MGKKKALLLCVGAAAVLAAAAHAQPQGAEGDGLSGPAGMEVSQGRSFQDFPGGGPGGGPGGFHPGMGGPRGFRPGMGGPLADPKMREHLERRHQLDQKLRESIRAYKEPPSKDKDAAKESLRKALGDIFDFELSERGERVKRMESDIIRLKESVSKGKASRDKIINRRLEDLAGSDSWEW